MRFVNGMWPILGETIRVTDIIRRACIVTCLLACALARPLSAADAPAAPVQPALPLVWPDPAATAAALQALPADVPGWSVTQAPKTYTRDNLHELLADAADRYLSYDYQWTATATYTSAKAAEGTVSVSVFAFGRDLDAFGAFSQERSATTVDALIHTQSFWDGTRLHVWRGPWYVRVVPSSTDEKVKVAGFKFAEAILKIAPGPPPVPTELTLLPTANLRAYTVKFSRRNLLGSATLHDGLTAAYDEDLPFYHLTPTGARPELPRSGTMRFVLMWGTDDAEAARIYADTQQALAPGERLDPVPGLGNAAAYCRTTPRGRLVVMRVRNYVAAVFSFDQTRAAEGLLRLLSTNIRVMLSQPPSPKQ